MRIKFKVSKVVTFSVLIINLLLFFISWKYFLTTDESSLEKAPLEFKQQLIEKISTLKPVNKIDRVQEAKKYLQQSLTIIFRDFYHFDNDLKSSIDHLLALIPDLKILIISEEFPYPPINIFTSNVVTNQTIKPSTLIYKENVQFVWLSMDITKSANELNPLNYIQTKYVLFMPDNFKLANARQMFQRMIKSITNEGFTRWGKSVKRKILIVPFSSNQRSINYCFQINSDIPNWTLEYEVKNYTTRSCDLYTQKHAILLESVLLNDLLEPFASPFPEYFYLQAKFANYQLQYSNESFHEGGKKLMTSYHSRSKRKSIKKNQFADLYRKLQMKKVVKKYQFIPEQKHLKISKKNREKGARLNNEKNTKGNGGVIKTGKEPNIDVLIEQLEIPASYVTNQSAQIQLRTDVHFFGCEKNTKSCIGQVYNEKPFYQYLNRHTPPCCLEKLKTVFHYIVEELENTGIRYWLDNLALRDALEFNDLSHDAFEIDISFNVNDYNRSTSLKRCFDSRPFTDLAGFYWIKATDGHYMKVQFSKLNEIHVNLLPFEIHGDRMIPKGFYGNKAKSFSTEFLHPMSTVYFLGRNVFTPNNVPNYLTMKGLKFE